MTPLVFLDTETTGLRPDIHTPWEVAWATAVHDGGELRVSQRRTFMVELGPRDVKRADLEALKIGRFTERYGLSHLSRFTIVNHLQEDLSNLSRSCGGKIPHLVGAVPSFDHAMLCSNWLGWPGYGEGLWHYHIIDVEILAAGKLGVIPPYSSSELTAALGVVVDEATKHTALGDVEWAMALYAAVYDLEVTDGIKS